MRSLPRRHGRVAALVIGAAVTALAAIAAVVIVTPASAATLFTSNFESGTSGWSKSGGDWSVVTDGSQVFQQADTSTDRAREFAGSTAWTNYSVQGRVKAVAFGSGGVVALASRASGATKMYRLALTSAGHVELQYMNGSTVTVLATSSRTITTGTWYTLRLDTSGSTIAGYIDGVLVGSVTNTGITAGRIGLFTGFASGRFDDVTVTDTTTTPTSAPPTSGSPTASPTPTTSPTPTASPTPTPTPSTTPTTGTLYVSPTGTAGAAGTLANPTSLVSAITRIAAGGTISMRGGTYNLATTVTIAPGNDGTASARKTLTAYNGEIPVLNFSAMAEDPANRGLALNANYWHIYGITVEYAGDNGIFIGGSNNIVERSVTAFNHDSGLQISRIASTTPDSQWPANNLVVSSESHDNADSDGEDADGFAAKLTAGAGNVFQYDVSHNNIDDGWDLFTKTDTGPIGVVTIENSLSYGNGTLTNGQQNAAGDRNGFKLGGDDIAVNHIVLRNIAYDNGHHGFTYNSNPGTITVTDNVSIDNTERNFSFDVGTSVFRNDTSCRFAVSGSNDKTSGSVDSSDQFWTGTNGSRCSSYTGTLGWSFASGGHLVVTFGGNPVTP